MIYDPPPFGYPSRRRPRPPQVGGMFPPPLQPDARHFGPDQESGRAFGDLNLGTPEQQQAGYQNAWGGQVPASPTPMPFPRVPPPPLPAKQRRRVTAGGFLPPPQPAFAPVGPFPQPQSQLDPALMRYLLTLIGVLPGGDPTR